MLGLFCQPLASNSTSTPCRLSNQLAVAMALLHRLVRLVWSLSRVAPGNKRVLLRCAVRQGRLCLPERSDNVSDDRMDMSETASFTPTWPGGQVKS